MQPWDVRIVYGRYIPSLPEIYRLCIPPGGQSHSGGDAYVRLKIPPFSASLSPKDPSFFIIACALTQRPHKFLYFSLTECQISLTEWKKIVLSPSEPLTFRPIRPHLFGFFSHRMPKIMLSPNDPSFFEPVLSPNAPLSVRGPYTRIHFKYDCPPGCIPQGRSQRGGLSPQSEVQLPLEPRNDTLYRGLIWRAATLSPGQHTPPLPPPHFEKSGYHIHEIH